MVLEARSLSATWVAAFYAKDFKHNIVSVFCCSPQSTQNPESRGQKCKRFCQPELTSKELVAYTYAIFPRSCKLPFTVWNCLRLDVPQQFCPQEIEREGVRRLHRALAHPNDRYSTSSSCWTSWLSSALSSHPTTCVTSEPCKACLTGKYKQMPAPSVEVGEMLVMDIFSFLADDQSPTS